MARKKSTAKKTKATGRPRIELDESILKALASIGASEVEICAGLVASGCQLDLRTLKRRLNEPKYRGVWDQGRNEFKVRLRRLQYRHAQMPNSAGVSMLIHMSKHQLGETDKSLLELTGKDGGPVETRDVNARQFIASRIASIAARKSKKDDPGKPE